MQLFKNHKASFNNNGDIIITNKNYQQDLNFAQTICISKLDPIDIPKGKTLSNIIDNEIEILIHCAEECASRLYRFERNDIDEYIEKV